MYDITQAEDTDELAKIIQNIEGELPGVHGAWLVEALKVLFNEQNLGHEDAATLLLQWYHEEVPHGHWPNPKFRFEA